MMSSEEDELDVLRAENSRMAKGLQAIRDVLDGDHYAAGPVQAAVMVSDLIQVLIKERDALMTAQRLAKSPVRLRQEEVGYAFLYRIQMSLSLSEEERQRANQVLNRAYTGHDSVPLDQPVAQDHQTAAHKLNMGRLVTLEIGIGRDGTWYLVKVHGMEPSHFPSPQASAPGLVARSRLQDVEGWLRDAEERRRRAEESLRAAEHRALKAEGALEEARKILDEIEDLYPWVLPEVTSEMLMQNAANTTGGQK